MGDIKLVTAEMKEGLKPYGFRQKGTSMEFLYDCKWYFIVAMLSKLGNGDVITLNGIMFPWHLSGLLPIREKTKESLNFTIRESEPTAIADACKWTNSKKEMFLSLYENPAEMLAYFRRWTDAHRYPHDYILARMLKDQADTEYFEQRARDYLQGINDHPGPAFGRPGSKLYEKNEALFRIREADTNHLMALNDTEFVEEITKRINETRKKFKLETYEKYF